MQEYVTEAIVLGIEPRREHDRSVSLYTKDLGKIDARVVSGAKIASKFSSHLDVLNKVLVRLVEKNRFTVADIILQDRFIEIRKNNNTLSRALRVVFVVRELMPNYVPDVSFWEIFLVCLESADADIASFLKLLGFNTSHASCGFCGNKDLHVFSTKEHTFLCRVCSSKVSENKVLLG